MAKFRRKPTEVEAVTCAEVLEHRKHPVKGLPQWVFEAIDSGEILFAKDGLVIDTLEGFMEAGHTDWIVKGVIGELFPVKPEAFEKNYEAV